MIKPLVASLLALTFVAVACRGHRGDPGPAGPAGLDGRDGTDTTTGYTFDYVRGIHGLVVPDGMLVIRADLVVPQTILDFAPEAFVVQKGHKSTKVTVSDGVQLAVGMPGATVRYFMVPVDVGDVRICTRIRGQEARNWTLTMDTPGYLAVVPMDSLTALTLDPSVIAKGALVEFPENEVRQLNLYNTEIWFGTDVHIDW